MEEEVLKRKGEWRKRFWERTEKPVDKEWGNGTEEESLMMNSTLKTTIKITLLMIIMNERTKERVFERVEGKKLPKALFSLLFSSSLLSILSFFFSSRSP